MKILIAGHSHVGSMILAAARMPMPEGLTLDFLRLSKFPDAPGFQKPGARDPSGLPRTRPPADRRAIRELSDATSAAIGEAIATHRPDRIVLAVMGNEYNGLVMVRHPDPFDFVSPHGPEDMTEGFDVIPFAAIRDRVAQVISVNTALFVQDFADHFDGPIDVLVPPPPIPDADHIMSNPGKFGDRAREYGINPALLRLKVWRLYAATLGDTVAAMGRDDIRVLTAPARALDAQGCLDESCWSGDPTHANQRYGRMLLQRLLRQTGFQPVRANAEPL